MPTETRTIRTFNADACEIASHAFDLYGRYSSKSDACGMVGGIITITLYSPDVVLAVGSLVFTDALLTAPAADGFYLDFSVSVAIGVDGSGAVESLLPCT